MRRSVAPALVAVAVVLCPATASAGATRMLCTRAVMYDTPGGLAIAYLVKRDRVNVLRYAAGRRWVRVRSRDLDVGWLRASALCK